MNQVQYAEIGSKLHSLRHAYTKWAVSSEYLEPKDAVTVAKHQIKVLELMGDELIPLDCVQFHLGFIFVFEFGLAFRVQAASDDNQVYVAVFQ